MVHIVIQYNEDTEIREQKCNSLYSVSRFQTSPMMREK
jgi:hypothetical protein